MAVVAPAITVAIARLAVDVAVPISIALSLAVSMMRSLVVTCIERECVVGNTPQPGPHVDVRTMCCYQELEEQAGRGYHAHGERSRCSLTLMRVGVRVFFGRVPKGLVLHALLREVPFRDGLCLF